MPKKVNEYAGGEAGTDTPHEAVGELAPQYIVTTDNPDFTGKTLGVQINSGRGLLNPATIDPRLGRTYEQVVREMGLLPGYHLSPA